MDWLQFFADVIRSLASLAWPAALIVAVWMFREKITELLPLVRLKYKDLDVSFLLTQAEQDAAELPATGATGASGATPEETDKFSRLARISPRAAIVERRAELEDALVKYATVRGMELPRGGILQLTRELRKNDLIDQPTSATLDDLRVIGNAAAHANAAELTESDAQRFRELSDRVMHYLQFLTAAAEMAPPGPLGPLQS